jgi:hypothetical protein
MQVELMQFLPLGLASREAMTGSPVAGAFAALAAATAGRPRWIDRWIDYFGEGRGAWLAARRRAEPGSGAAARGRSTAQATGRPPSGRRRAGRGRPARSRRPGRAAAVRMLLAR